MDGIIKHHQRPKSRGNFHNNSGRRRPQQQQQRAVQQDRFKSECTACGTVHQPNDCPARSAVCFKCNKTGHFSNKCRSSTIKQPSSTRPSTGYWHGCGRSTNRGRGCDTRRNVHEAETRDTSKPIADTTNSEVDVVKLLQACGMVSSEGSEFRHRKVRQIDIDDISVQTSNFANDVHTVDLASNLHGSTLLDDVDVLWESTEHIQPIHICTAS